MNGGGKQTGGERKKIMEAEHGKIQIRNASQ